MVIQYEYFRHLEQTNPLLDPDIKKRIRLAWSAFAKQSNILRDCLPFCSIKAKGFQSVCSLRHGLRIKDLVVDQVPRKEIKKRSKKNGGTDITNY